jgi:SAM-dependent methyltransferase
MIGRMTTQAIDADKLNDFVGQVFNDFSAGYIGLMVYVGHQLGLYKAMRGAGPVSARELAARSECEERYVTEWLNSQVAARYVDYHPLSQTFELTPEQALVLAEDESPAFLAGAWQLPASLWTNIDRSVAAFRSGKGVAWGDHDSRMHAGVAAFYRNGYQANLVQHWLPTLDGVVDRLEEGVAVADIGCGYGYSTVLMAQAFPKSRFVGFDPHAPSIDEARKIATQAGTGTRVSFEVASAIDYSGTFDLICFFDCLHDLGDAVAAARTAAQALAPGGTVMLVEPFANDRLEDNVNPVGRLFYTGSTLLCCAHAISEGGNTVLGAQAGEARLAEVFRKAGFTHFRRAAETPFNLILEARLS